MTKQCTDTDYKKQMIQKEYTLTVSEKSPSISLLSPWVISSYHFIAFFSPESFPCIYRDGEMVKILLFLM